MLTDLEIYASYLPYGVKVMYKNEVHNICYVSRKILALISPKGYGEVIKIKWEYVPNQCKLLLRPLEELYTHRLPNGQTLPQFWAEKDPLSEFHLEFDNITFNKIPVIQTRCYISLLKQHFDVFNLIPQEKAINKNKI